MSVHEFLDAAKRQGTSDESLVGLLRGRGWSEEDAYRALADHYEIPRLAFTSPATDVRARRRMRFFIFSVLRLWRPGRLVLGQC